MLIQELKRYCPSEWSVDFSTFKYKEVDIPAHSIMYQTLTKCMGQFAVKIMRVTRVENPYHYGSFLLKKAEYESRGVSVQVKELYHDTGKHKVDSILSTNLDWRKVCRSKFGRGVSFSPDTSYAHRHSSAMNGNMGAMIIADVLVGSSEDVYCSGTLPSGCNDTNIGNGGKVFVKFYDDEFCPKYVVYYNSSYY